MKEILLHDALGISPERHEMITKQIDLMVMPGNGDIEDCISIFKSFCKSQNEFGYACFILGASLQETQGLTVVSKQARKLKRFNINEGYV